MRPAASIYLVFEYMEHDLSGLSSNPDIRFTESQVQNRTRALSNDLFILYRHWIEFLRFSYCGMQDQMLHAATTLGTRALSYARRNT